MRFKLLPPAELGRQLVRLRKMRGWKQAEFARRLSKTQPEVSRWEKGRVAATYDTVAMFAKALGVEVSEFMEETAELNGNGHSDELPPYNEGREEAELARIGALPDSLLRTMERESIAAVIRAQGIRDACRAARIEAEKAPDRSAAAAQYRTTPMQGFPDQSAGETERAAS